MSVYHAVVTALTVRRGSQPVVSTMRQPEPDIVRHSLWEQIKRWKPLGLPRRIEKKNNGKDVRSDTVPFFPRTVCDTFPMR